ncbi:outer membrane protein assembly factor BamB family protein [Caldiplasma sukawensis]
MNKFFKILVFMIIILVGISSTLGYEVINDQKIIKNLRIFQTSPGNTNASKIYYTGCVQFEGNSHHIYTYYQNVSSIFVDLNCSIIVDPYYYHNNYYVDLTNMSSGGGGLADVNGTTGAVKWIDRFSNEVMTEPIGIYGIIFIGLGNNTFQCENIRGTGINYIAAVNSTNGKILWKYYTLGEDMPTPVFYDGLLIEADGSGKVFSLNAFNGSLVWKDTIYSFVSMSSLLLYDGNVYFGGGNPYCFYSVNAETGKINWTYLTNGTGGLTDASPVYSDGNIVTGYTITCPNGTMKSFTIALNAVNGNPSWITYDGIGCQPEFPPIEVPPLTSIGNIIFTEPTSLCCLLAINAFNGSILWRQYTGLDDANVNVVGGFVITVTYNGTMMIFNMNGNLVCSKNFGVPMGPGNVIVFNNAFLLFGMNGVMKTVKYNFYRAIKVC